MATRSDGTITVGVRGLLVTALAVLALVTAYLLGSDGGGTPAQAAPQPSTGTAEEPRVLSLRGTGQATAVPDQLSFTLTVTAERADLDDALESTSGTLARVLAALREHGVARRDLQTSGLSMSPEYDYPAYSAPVLTGYRVTQRSTVLVRELGEAGAAISSAVAVGGNAVRVGDIRLRVGDPDAVLAEARREAVAEATAKARQYAAATGQELGAVATLREVGGGQRGRLQAGYPAYARAARDVVDLRAVPVRAGEEDLEVTVEIVWQLG